MAKKNSIALLQREMETGLVAIDGKIQAKRDLLEILDREASAGVRTAEEKQEQEESHRKRELVCADIRFLSTERFSLREKFEGKIRGEERRIEKRQASLQERLAFGYLCECTGCHAVVPAYKLPADKRPPKSSSLRV